MCRLAGDETCRLDRAILALLKRGLKAEEVAAHPKVGLTVRSVNRRIARMREAYEVLSNRSR